MATAAAFLDMPVVERPAPAIEEDCWQGVAICQRKIHLPGTGAYDLTSGRTWPAEWVDTNYQNFGEFWLSKTPNGDLQAWAEMSLLRLSELFEQQDPSLGSEIILRSHDNRFVTVIKKVSAPDSSVFRASNITLFAMRIKER